MTKPLSYKPIVDEQIMGVELSRTIRGFLADRYERVDFESTYMLCDNLVLIGFLMGLATQAVEGADNMLRELKKHGKLVLFESIKGE